MIIIFPLWYCNVRQLRTLASPAVVTVKYRHHPGNTSFPPWKCLAKLCPLYLWQKFTRASDGHTSNSFLFLSRLEVDRDLSETTAFIREEKTTLLYSPLVLQSAWTRGGVDLFPNADWWDSDGQVSKLPVISLISRWPQQAMIWLWAQSGATVTSKLPGCVHIFISMLFLTILGLLYQHARLWMFAVTSINGNPHIVFLRNTF